MIASASFPCSISVRPRLLWAPKLSGLSWIATRCSAIASASFPLPSKAAPRCVCPPDEVGLRRSILLEFRDRFVQRHPGPNECYRDSHALGILRIDSQCFTVFGNRLIDPPLSSQVAAKVVVCSSGTRVQTQDLAIRADRFRELTQFTQSETQREVGGGKSWLEPNRRADRQQPRLRRRRWPPSRAPATLQRHAHAKAMTTFLRPQPDQIFVDDDSLVRLAFRFQGVSQLMSRLGLERPRRRVVPNCLFPPRKPVQTSHRLRLSQASAGKWRSPARSTVSAPAGSPRMRRFSPNWLRLTAGKSSIRRPGKLRQLGAAGHRSTTFRRSRSRLRHGSGSARLAASLRYRAPAWSLRSTSRTDAQSSRAATRAILTALGRARTFAGISRPQGGDVDPPFVESVGVG